MTVIKRIFIFFIKFILFAATSLSFLPSATSTTVSVRSEVEGEGFHRTLKYYIDTNSIFLNKTCYIAVFIDLPSYLYVNVDELADLRRVENITACSQGEVDVELFAEKANYQNVSLCSKLTSTKMTLSVPIHQRYRFATKTGDLIRIFISRPLLFVGCNDRVKEFRVSKIRLCWPCIGKVKKWRDIFYTWEGDGDFAWEIPSGNTSRKVVVAGVTIFVTLLGGAYVLWAIYKSFRVPLDRKVKDS